METGLCWEEKKNDTDTLFHANRSRGPIGGGGGLNENQLVKLHPVRNKERGPTSPPGRPGYS